MDDGFSILNIWAVIFLTCIVGLIEFLQELKHWHQFDGMGKKYSLYKPAVFGLYFCLVFGAIICIERFVGYYFATRNYPQSCGSPLFDYAFYVLFFGVPQIPIGIGWIVTIFIFGSLFLYQTDCHPINYLRQAWQSGSKK